MIENHNLIKLEDESFEEAIKNDFDLLITDTEKIINGYSNQVYRGKLQDQIVFIRTNKDPNIFEVELSGYKIFEKQGIPVPKIIAYNQNPQSIGYPTMIMSSAQGEALEKAKVSEAQDKVIYENIGKLLKKINKTKLKGFGPLLVIDQELVGQFSTWKEYCESQQSYNIRNLNFSKDNSYITTEESDKIKQIYKEIEAVNLEKASLLHTDMHVDHIFVEGDKISGVIDLGRLTAGDSRYDIAYSLIFQNLREQECFKKGYGELAQDPMVDKYLIIIVIDKIHFRSKKEINGNVEELLPILKDALSKLS
jgi:aminoglycoside phosphotransferase (APT) family kinase protein